MPLVLNARNNGTYGGNLINQKYKPLDNPALAPPDHAYYRQLFSARQGLLTGINAYPPNTLNFYGNLPVPAIAVAPLVVVSSNRANWMQAILQNAANHGPFTGYLDATSFHSDVVPWYAPLRSGRPVYIVVHWSEYDYYEARVGGGAFPNVTVVGYKFTATAPALDIVGFGASRYAALQLMINQGYHQAWTVDDNVVNVNGFPNTLDVVEAFMPLGGGAPIWGIGFTGATVNTGAATLYAPGTLTFAAVPPAFGTTVSGLLQQVVLWNLDQLRAANINFSPLFVASNEDVSLSSYLQFNHLDQRIITACSIVKYEPANDPWTNRGASLEIPRRRNRLLGLLDGIEGEIPFLPVGGGAQVTLQTYIRQTVLPNSLNNDQAIAQRTQSCAIEQFMAEAIKQGWYPAAPLNPFNPFNGAPVIGLLLPAAL
ncbi:hypothetical protein [Collimonas sp.]|jgi:hypothetical protein|uniref:hypothetical protein n=1 Tax=Collimonas sp. TaxID=1963772 RepID=UPI002BCF7506|nr:hypothetical protein [Collimonas sp.]HWW07277.1 hypothetical protein [Collimonas sp.]